MIWAASISSALGEEDTLTRTAFRGCEGGSDTSGYEARFEHLASGVVMWCSANGETTRVETDGREVRVPLPTYGMWIHDLKGSIWIFTEPTPAGNVVQLSTGERVHVPSDRHTLLAEVMVPETWVWLDQAAADWTLACVDGSSTYFRSGAADSTLLHRVRAGGGVRSKPLPGGPVGPGGGCLAGSLLVGSRPDSVVWFRLPSLRAAGEVPATVGVLIASASRWGLWAWDNDDTHIAWASVARSGRLVGSGVITLEQRGVLNDLMYMDEEVCVAVTERKNPADPIDGFVVRVVCQTVDPEVSRQVEKWERWLDRFQRLSRNREQSAADDMAPRSTRQRASRTERIPTRSGG